jgi:hypothetical protein
MSIIIKYRDVKATRGPVHLIPPRVEVLQRQFIRERLSGRFGFVVGHEQHPQQGASMHRPFLFW